MTRSLSQVKQNIEIELHKLQLAFSLKAASICILTAKMSSLSALLLNRCTDTSYASR